MVYISADEWDTRAAHSYDAYVHLCAGETRLEAGERAVERAFDAERRSQSGEEPGVLREPVPADGSEVRDEGARGARRAQVVAKGDQDEQRVEQKP